MRLLLWLGWVVVYFAWVPLVFVLPEVWAVFVLMCGGPAWSMLWLVLSGKVQS